MTWPWRTYRVARDEEEHRRHLRRRSLAVLVVAEAHVRHVVRILDAPGHRAALVQWAVHVVRELKHVCGQPRGTKDGAPLTSAAPVCSATAAPSAGSACTRATVLPASGMAAGMVWRKGATRTWHNSQPAVGRADLEAHTVAPWARA